ncbi:MAG: aldehyde dehydrogenase (NADP(+)) [Burkholderiaceae bacterium]
MNLLASLNARTGETAGEPLTPSTPEQIDQAVQAAHAAAAAWGASSGQQRAALLRTLADGLAAERDALVAQADLETALGQPRLTGELDRTTFQLRRFADMAERGEPFRVVDDPAVAGAPPVGHPAMQLQRVPLGPVAMFAASNFPFAFSVLGGDTASALAAGCPVVVKAHPGHPRLSQQVFAICQRALQALELPAGVIGMVQGADVAVGVQLIRHPLIAAGAFTGSTRGGIALQNEANARPRPIPFYGELGAINPLVALPAALAAKGPELAATLAGSITLGCGQFCTNPGLLVLLDGAETDRFVGHLVQALGAQKPHPMLTPGMRRAFDAGIQALLGAGAEVLVQGQGDAPAPAPHLLQVGAQAFIARHELREEVFGPGSLIVRCADMAEVHAVLNAVGGSLTVTIWGADEGSDEHRDLVRSAMQVAGRVLFAGVPTGVAVTSTQMHGGPWPASTAPMTTSVGDAALERFLRPVCLQDAPSWLVARQGVPC